MVIEQWMRDEMMRRKALIRDLWDGKPVSQIPIDVRVNVSLGYTTRELVQNADKQLETSWACVEATWKHAPSSDAVPALQVDVGCSCLASAFGSEYYWGENENQTPGIKHYIINDLPAQVDSLSIPDPYRDGWLPEGLRRIKMFAESGEGFTPTCCMDAAGGVNVAADLMGMTPLLEAFYDEPEALHVLLKKIQELYIRTIRAEIEAAGGEENITTTDFVSAWFPEGRKGHVSDDICASFSPKIYNEFSAPYHALIFKEFGAGGLHNCGPNPCHSAYVAHELSPRCIDLNYTYSKDDLPLLKLSLKKKAFIYLAWDGSGNPVEWYRNIMELMTPDVIVMPAFFVGADTAEPLIKELKPIASEYAKRMDWGWR